MHRIKFEKYFMSCYNYESEGVYLGKSLKRNRKNKHLFMVWHSFMKGNEKPVIIGCEDFKIHEGNKLEVFATRMYFPTLSRQEKDFVTNLAKRYWK